jgi:hypothetical protein
MQTTQFQAYPRSVNKGRLKPIPRSAVRDRLSADALGLSPTAIIMTIPALKPIRASKNAKKPLCWNEDLSTAHATMADLGAAKTVQKAIAHSVLERLYGKAWNKSHSAHRFTWYACPETISKDGYGVTQLHWHVTFDTDQLETMGADAIFGIVQGKADKIHARLCDQCPLIYLSISETPQRYVDYSQKFHGVGSKLYNSAMIVSSRAKRAIS